MKTKNKTIANLLDNKIKTVECLTKNNSITFVVQAGYDPVLTSKNLLFLK